MTSHPYTPDGATDCVARTRLPGVTLAANIPSDRARPRRCAGSAFAGCMVGRAERREASATAATELIKQHGDQTDIEAAARADEYEAKGDRGGQRVWLRILNAIDALQRVGQGGDNAMKPRLFTAMLAAGIALGGCLAMVPDSARVTGYDDVHDAANFWVRTWEIAAQSEGVNFTEARREFKECSRLPRPSDCCEKFVGFFAQRRHLGNETLH